MYVNYIILHATNRMRYVSRRLSLLRVHVGRLVFIELCVV